MSVQTITSRTNDFQRSFSLLNPSSSSPAQTSTERHRPLGKGMTPPPRRDGDSSGRQSSHSPPPPSLRETPTNSRTNGSRRGLSSKLSSMFSSKGSHINEYNIELEDSIRHYGPGDRVRGKVVLNVAKPLGVTHISICLLGFVQVLKGNSRAKPGYRANGTRSATGQGKRWTSEYYGDGYASLFEDEMLLCGEGRLDPKLYHFKFELQFPDNLRLPSSIDFERGTVSYYVFCTITRPTTIGATLTDQKKVIFRDNIDVAAFPPSKPSKAILEPIRKTGRRSHLKKFTSHTASSINGSIPDSIITASSNGSVGSPAASEHTATPTPSHSADSGTRHSHSTPSNSTSQPPQTAMQQAQQQQHRPHSPSHRSIHSVTSSNRRDSSPRRNSPSEPRSSRTSQSHKSDADPRDVLTQLPNNHSKVSFGQATDSCKDPSTITASVQLARTGCLPGDIIPVNITINHTKPIRSLNGIVVTLYRQARVDAHPNLPIGEPDGDPQYEDYYPRSKTGLGGLSLSAAGSSQVWRKDLAQTFAPLYIDPKTMSATIKTSLRMPDDAFPSIRNAPGDMISFRYFVEVIMDIHGKLANQDLKRISREREQQTFASSPGLSGGGGGADDETSTKSSWATNCIDTTSLQRDKNTVTCVCDIVVGTRDSEKSRGKQRAPTSAPAPAQAYGYAPGWRPEWDLESPADPSAYPDPGPYDYDEAAWYGYPGYEQGYYDGSGAYDYEYEYGYGPYDGYWPGPQAFYPPGYMQPSQQQQQHPYAYPVPPPDDDEVPEKERLRRAEARLLPSAPPMEDAGAGAAPSAPALPEEHAYQPAPIAAPGPSHGQAGPSAPSGLADAASAPPASALDGPSAPPAEEFGADEARGGDVDEAFRVGETSDNLPRYEK